MKNKLDKDLQDLYPDAITGSHERRNVAWGKAQIFNIQSIRNLGNNIRDLQKTTIKLDRANNKLSKKLYWLTVVTVILSAIGVIQVVGIILSWIGR